VTNKLIRCPILTLWATVVAERMGFDHYEALTLGWAIAGVKNPNRDTWLATFRPIAKKLQGLSHNSSNENRDIIDVHSSIPIVKTPDGVRALENGRAVRPAVVAKYLDKSFGESLETVESAMAELAQGYSPDELAVVGHALHEKFYSALHDDVEGWDTRTPLDLEAIRERAVHKG
jgi:hypothetical protein